MFEFLNRRSDRRKYINRVVVVFLDYCSAGSGFFVNKEGKLITCFHVAFGKDMNQLRKDEEFLKIKGDEPARLREYYDRRLIRAEVEFADGSKAPAELKDFDPSHDIAAFEIEGKREDIRPCKIDWNHRLDYGEKVSFGGFPEHWDYKREQAPFAVQEGMVSAFVETTIGGDRYEHIQINSLTLQGNSGAPLFRGRSNKVVGVINGTMEWNIDNTSLKDAGGRPLRATLKTPLPVAYATPIRFLKKFINQ